MLTHMLVTDLSDSEIVLGKLAARLLPVFALVGATVPVLALAGLLGGIIIEAIATLTLITFVVAVLGCALALAFSVRATKVHEVLMAVYGIEAVWIVGPLVWSILEDVGGLPGPPDWYVDINPFVLAWAPYDVGRIALESSFMLWCWAAATSLVGGTGRLRRASAQGRGDQRGSIAQNEGVLLDFPGTRVAGGQAPGPVARRRPGPLARVAARAAVTAGQDHLGILYRVGPGRHGIERLHRLRRRLETLSGSLSGFQATFGLLLVSMTAPTALAEERARGSLDVLMTTPLSTDRIVLAKWWGAYRVVPALAFLPAIGALVVAFAEPEIALVRSPERAQPLDPLGWIDRVAFVCLPTALMLAQGAVVTSFGLALATWMRRVGRAIAASVASYAVIAFGWLVLLELGVVSSILSWLGAL